MEINTAVSGQVICYHHPKYINKNETKQAKHCSEDEMFLGQWNLFESIEQPSYLNCPNTYKNLVDSPKAHAATYSKNTIHHACFTTESNCQIMPLEHSVKEVAKRLSGRKMLFVGDSLGGQQFVEASCSIENIFWYNAIYTELVMHTTLVQDMLCSSNCSNPIFLASQLGKFPSACAECPNGIRSDQHPVFSKIKDLDDRQYGILVLNTGAWFLNCWGVDNPQKSYREMLELIHPVLNALVEKGIVVVWMALPETSQGLIDYNGQVKDIFSENIIVVNAKDTISKRISVDHDVTYDGIHFASPGIFTVTSFTTHSLFHILASRHCYVSPSSQRNIVFKEGSLEIKAFSVVKSPAMTSPYYIVLEDGKKHLIWDWDTFLAMGLNPNDVITLSEKDLSAIKVGYKCPVLPG